MMKGTFTAMLGIVFLLAFAECAGGPRPVAPESLTPDSKGNLIIHNQSGVELAFYVDKVYKKTAKSEDRFTINLDYVEEAGTLVELECFYRDKIGDVSVYPNDVSAKYYSFIRVVRPLWLPEPVDPIIIPALSSKNLNIVPVRVSYRDYPRLVSQVLVRTGDTPIAMLQNGDSMVIRMPVGLHQITVEYVVHGRVSQRKVYPQNENQRKDERFLIQVPSGVTEAKYEIPMLSDVFNVTYVTSESDTSMESAEFVIGDAKIQ